MRPRPSRFRSSLARALPALAALAALPLLAPLAVAQQPAAAAPPAAAPATSLTGYTAASAAQQRTLEASAVARPDSARAEAHARALTTETHVAGTPAQARTRDYVVAEMRKLGLETSVRAYRVYLPHATAVHVWRLGGDGAATELPLAEPAVAGDPTSALAQYPTVNGYSAAGDATGEVVYVNYGLIEDYAQLDSIGVDVRGRVVVARYGRSFRGIKAREAEKRGAVALLIYSDPADDGYVRGDVYPDGPMRPPRGVQRGSVFNGSGDPTTPGWPSTDAARRLPVDSSGVPTIPVVPIGYGNAAELLRELRGATIPQTWQGGLAFRYHAGPGPVRARVQVTTDEATAAYKTIWNTFGTVRGSTWPDEMIVVGAHRDGWTPGAADNVSGTVSVLESARAVMEEVRAGRRPKRTLVFATWDAEEWGLLGSTEYTEDDSVRLARHGVAYLNQDVAAQGPAFGGGGSPSLRAVLRDVARVVPDPSGTGDVYAAWRRRTAVADTAEPAMGDPGGGSDFAGFYNHLGIPHAEWGFGGPGGVYHSQYDSFAWMSRFADPGFRYHAAAARVGTALLLRLANAEVLPFDYEEYARTLRKNVASLRRVGPRVPLARETTAATSPTAAVTPATVAARPPGDAMPGAPPGAAAATRAAVDLAPIEQALDRLAARAQAFAQARDAALAAATPPSTRVLTATNDQLKQVERALVRPEGLRTRPWYRNLVYASDEDNGYATILFPSVAEALRAGDASLAAREVADLAARIDAAGAALDRARAAVGGR